MKHRIIPIFIPHLGCPSHCVYCDQDKQTGTSDKGTLPDIPVCSITRKFLSTMKDEDDFIEIGFFGGTFTGLKPEMQKSLLEKAHDAMKANPRVRGIRLSTHPRCVNTAAIELLKPYPITVIELGIQSLDNDVLKR